MRQQPCNMLSVILIAHVIRYKLGFGILRILLILYTCHSGSNLGLNCAAVQPHVMQSVCNWVGCLRRDWNMVHLATRMFLRGRHVGLGGLLRTWLPFCLLICAAAVLAGVLGGKA